MDLTLFWEILHLWETVFGGLIYIRVFNSGQNILLEEIRAVQTFVLCFFFKVFFLLLSNGSAGLIGTETIKEGDTQLLGLKPIVNNGNVFRAVSSMKWPGKAATRIAVVWFSKNTDLRIPIILDGKHVNIIDEFLTEKSVAVDIKPRKLINGLEGGIGSDNSKGESLLLEQGNDWLNKLRESGVEYCRQYVTGDDLTSHGFQNSSRWVVDVQGDSLEEIKNKSHLTYKYLLDVVKPIRTPEYLSSQTGLEERWWQLWRARESLYKKIRENKSCIIMPVVSKYLLAKRVPTEWVFTNKFIVLVETRNDLLLILSSNISDIWFRRFSGTLGETLSLSVTKALNTFPLPSTDASADEQLIDKFVKIRESWIVENQKGFTELYNKYHEKNNADKRISMLRNIHVAIDQYVLGIYGWDDIQSKFDFYDTPQGTRFTISEATRQDVLVRLLALNHERYEKEVRLGLHDKKKKGKGGKGKNPKNNDEQMELF